MKGYKLSTNYKLLYNLIQKGYRIPAWIIYSNEYKRPIYDLIEVKLAYLSKKYFIGCRGIEYGSFEDDLKSFVENCNHLKLKFIRPNKLLNKVKKQ